MAAGCMPKTQIPGGAAPWGIAFAGVVHGVWIPLHPRATCRSLPAPSRAPGRINCVRTGAEEFGGDTVDGLSVPPVRRGCRRDRAPCAPLPFNYILPPRGSGLQDSPAARWVGPQDVLP
ncbi:hypothetical protein N7449_012534 [Penicillium cf. viridicatum]|uniref:Uncharacterized protein n=1 Tax=Penicillium cf. viridicatum TaxID=2972119 RepID=A0A9W9LWZ6_9EURO|nr:hypothetical protein N7449_012534 [Penicillium cf. viridicatum]